MIPTKRKYNKRTPERDKKLIEIVKTSFSIAEVLKKLDLRPAGGNYLSVKTMIKELNIDCSHFVGKSWNKGQRIGKIQDLTSHKAIKERLYEERGRKCEKCKLEKWQDENINLELHHVNGNRFDNNSENLQILCPNCHSQTPNFRNKCS